MPYLGSQLARGFATTTKQSFSGDASTVAFTLTRNTGQATDLEVFVDNVQQEPTTAYGVSGTTLTFTAAPSTGTNNIYVIHRGGGSTGNLPPQDLGATDYIFRDDISFKSDSAKINFGADSDITLTHVADTGLILKNTHTSGNSGIGAILTLQTGDTDVAADNVLGQIDFQAPDEGAGTDAILVAAGIAAVSEGDFSSSNNATKLSFKTGASETATEKMSLSSGGNLTIISNDAGAGTGPRFDLTRNSASPAANDILGQIRFMGEDAADNSLSYVSMFGQLIDPTDGSEDGSIELDVRLAGTNRSRMISNATETVFNDDSVDLDFRVESNGNANMIFVEGSTDRVAIGTGTTDTGTMLTVAGAATFTGQNTAHGASRLKIGQDTTAISQIRFYGANTSTNGILQFTGSSSDASAGGERMRIDATGNIGIGTTSIDVSTQAGGSGYKALQIESDEGAQINLDHNDAGTGSTLGQINFQRAGEVVAEIEGVTDGATDNGRIAFRTQPNGGALTERMRIDHDGNIGIGTGTTTPLRQLHIFNTSANSEIAFTAGTSGVSSILFGDGQSGADIFRGYVQYNHNDEALLLAANAIEHLRIAANGDLTATDTSIASNSDERLKENIADYAYDIAKFKQYEPKTFDWKNADAHNGKTGNRGFLAQAVKTIDDKWVGEANVSEDSLDYDIISDNVSLTSKLGDKDAMYISVIQQLIAKIETLETKVAALEG